MDPPPGTEFFTLQGGPPPGPAFLMSERMALGNFIIPGPGYNSSLHPLNMGVQQPSSHNARSIERGNYNRDREERETREREERSSLSKRFDANRDVDYRTRDERRDRSESYHTSERENYTFTRSQDDDYEREFDSDHSTRRGSNDKDDRKSSHFRYKDRERSQDRSKERSRERSRSRDRDRSKERAKDKDYDRDRDRERRRPGGGVGGSSSVSGLSSPTSIEWREGRGDEIPNQTIMVRGLPSHVTEDDLKEEVARFGLVSKDIRLLRKKDTGVSRGFAFVEFQLLSEAVRWKELTQGILEFPGSQYKAALHYSIPKDCALLDRNINGRQDWNCVKCGVNNFRRRDYCFKCNSTREDGETTRVGEGSHEVSSTPSNTLLFRNLDILTTEERVLSVLGNLTSLPIKSLKIAKDSQMGTSRGFCFVELHSTAEATHLHDTLLSMPEGFFIDRREVLVSYTRRSLTSMNSVASANAASVALAAAQWTNQGGIEGQFFPRSYPGSENYGAGQARPSVDMDPAALAKVPRPTPSVKGTSSTTPAVDHGTVNIEGISYNKYPIPDVSQYQYDETSGYYYDHSTGLYYDASSQYYFNSEIQSYLYWDGTNQTYLPAPSQAQAKSASSITASSAPSTATESTEISDPGEKDVPEKSKFKDKDKHDKVKIAKKIAKDMERWAKTLNQKKENAKLGVPMIQGMPLINVGEENPYSFGNNTRQSAAADAGFAILEKRSTALERQALLTEVMKGKEISDNLPGALVASYGDGSDSDGEDGNILDTIRSEENKLVDYQKLACLLCKRQFPSPDVLKKHQMLSDLHKQNLNTLRRSKLTPEEFEELQKREREGGYRDRAKERREKYGQPDVPKSSKLKDKYLKHLRMQQATSFEEPTKEGIGSENIGNKMLKAMGWSEGQGLGRENQGMAGIIDVTRRISSAGLGMKGATYGATAKDSYKDAAKKAMQARYSELDS